MTSLPVDIRSRSLVAGALATFAVACGRLDYDPVGCASAPECVDATTAHELDGSVSARDDGAISRDAAFARSDASSLGTDELPCGSLQLLQDDFSSTDARGVWAPLHRRGRVTRANGRVELSVEAAADAYASYHAQTAYDLRNSELAIEVERADSGTTLELRDGKGMDRFSRRIVAGERGVGLAVEGGSLRALTIEGESSTLVVSTIYDPAQHRFWRIRERAGQVSWETSPDRERWSLLHSQAVALDASHVFATLALRGTGAAAQAWFDDVNEIGADLPAYCGPGSLRDDFDDDVLGPSWLPWNGQGTCTITERRNAVELDFTRENAACSLRSTTRVDLRAAALSFELVDILGDGSFTTRFALTDPSYANSVELRIRNGVITLAQVVGGSEVFTSTLALDRRAHRFFRVREHDGRAAWDTSPDGATWQNRAEATLQFHVDAVTVDFWGFQASSAASDAKLVIDRVSGP